MRRWGIVMTALAVVGCPKKAPEPPPPRSVVDAHMHVSPTELDRLHSIMDETGVAWGLNLSGLWPGGPLERQLEAARTSGRMKVACNLPWVAARMRADFPQLAAAMLKRAKSLGAVALKIEKALGLAVRGTDGQLLRVDDPWLDPIWKTAGELKLPVIIHTGDPKAFWLPVDEKNERYEELKAHPSWSNYGEPVPSFDALLQALMRVVARHPHTTFISVHFGNNAEDPFWVGTMLQKHPNLFVDLAARVPELGRHDPKKLREVFIKHQDRILFGSDLGVSPKNHLMLGSFGEEPNKRSEAGPYFQAQYKWLETTQRDMPSPTPIQGRWKIHGLGLPAKVLEKVYKTNAERLFGGPPKTSDASTPRSPPRSPAREAHPSSPP